MYVFGAGQCWNCDYPVHFYWNFYTQISATKWRFHVKLTLSLHFFNVSLQPNAGHGLLILEASRSHITTYHSRQVSSGWVISSSQRPLPESYVYWNVHHLDSWVKWEQLDVTCFIISLFNAQHVSDVNTSILRSLRLICWIISWVVLLWFDVCWCYVVVWFGWGGAVSVCRLKH